MSKELDNYEPNMFAGEEYPLNYVFNSWVLGLEDALKDGDVVGYAQSIPSAYTDRPNTPNQVLLWDQGTVISKSPNRK